MAVINKQYQSADFPLAISRQSAFPLDADSVFYSLQTGEDYAKTSLNAYPGQIISVVDEQNNLVSIYKVNIDGSLSNISGEPITIDKELNSTSKNPVENQAIYKILVNSIIDLQNQINKIVSGDTSQDSIVIVVADVLQFLSSAAFYPNGVTISTPRCTVNGETLIIA